MLSTDRGSISSVTDNGDGTYTATLSSTSAGIAHLTGTLNGSAIGHTTAVTFMPGAADAAHSTSRRRAGLAESRARAPPSPSGLRDQYGNALTRRRRHGRRSRPTAARSARSPTTATAPTPPPSARPRLGRRARHRHGRRQRARPAPTVTFTPGAADAAHSTLAAAPDLARAPAAASTVTVQPEGQYGNALTAGGDTVHVSTDRGCFGSVTDNGDGTYTATLSSPRPAPRTSPAPSTATRSAGATVTLRPARRRRAPLDLSASPTSLDRGRRPRPSRST